MATADGAGGLPRGGLLLLVALSLGWGLFWPLMKVSMAELPILTFRALCAELGGLLLLAMAALSRLPLRVPREDLPGLLLLSLLSTTGWLYFSALGVQLLGSGRAALIAYTMPLWAFLLGVWLLGEQPTLRRWIGLGLGLAGVVVLVAQDVAQMQRAPVGVAVMLVTAVCWAAGSVMVKRRSWGMATPTLAGWQSIIGGLPLCVGALALDLDRLQPLSPSGLLAVAYTIVVGVAFGIYAWYRVVRMVPMSVASLAILAVPVIGLASSAIIVGEPIELAEIAALLLIIGGLATVLPLPRLPWRRPSRDAMSDIS